MLAAQKIPCHEGLLPAEKAFSIGVRSGTVQKPPHQRERLADLRP